MKTFLILLIIPMISFADQLSVQESSLMNATTTYYTSADRRIQYNYDIKDKYIFMQYRRAGVCPYYCGFNYNMFGLGFGANHKIGFANLFVQAGYYIIKNSIGKTKYDENLYYYFNARFAEMDNTKNFKSYEVRNNNAYAITIGADIPMTKRAGIKISYQHMKMKENIMGYFSGPDEPLSYWQDPMNRDLSTINAGFYFNF